MKDQDHPEASSITLKSLPRIGYIAMLEDQPIAAGFLRKIEGNKGILDLLISNPYFGDIIQQKGMSKVLEQLILDTKQLELNSIFALPMDTMTSNRLKALGFGNESRYLEYRLLDM